MTEGAMTGSTSTQWHGRDATVAVAGEVDLASSPGVESAIGAAVDAAGATGVVVDLSQVTFLDSSGINALLNGRRLAEGHGVGYVVVGAQGQVLTVLELTGVWPHLSGPTA